MARLPDVPKVVVPCASIVPQLHEVQCRVAILRELAARCISEVASAQLRRRADAAGRLPHQPRRMIDVAFEARPLHHPPHRRAAVKLERPLGEGVWADARLIMTRGAGAGTMVARRLGELPAIPAPAAARRRAVPPILVSSRRVCVGHCRGGEGGAVARRAPVDINERLRH
eukprot:scaffold6821_cov66-Phaeocystis_antarctica.AAC.9